MAIAAERLQDRGLIFPAENVVHLKRQIFSAAGDAFSPSLPSLQRRTIEALPAPMNETLPKGFPTVLRAC